MSYAAGHTCLLLVSSSSRAVSDEDGLEARNPPGSSRACCTASPSRADVSAPIAAGMTKQIQLSVLYTQQMLELVNLSPGAPGHESSELTRKIFKEHLLSWEKSV